MEEERSADSSESYVPSDISDTQEPVLAEDNPTILPEAAVLNDANPTVDSNDNPSIESNQDRTNPDTRARSDSSSSTYRPPVPEAKARALIDLMRQMQISIPDDLMRQMQIAVPDDLSKASSKSSASSKPSTIETDKDRKYKVDPPIIGGVTNHGKYQVAWTGGKPNCTWTGLEEPNTVNWNPRRERTAHYKGFSNYAERQAGLYGTHESSKFKSGDNLDFFIKKLLEAFVDFGMDTICYRLDPSDPTKTKVINVFTQYPGLAQDTIKMQSEWVKSRYDEYSKNNDKQARKFILNSLCTKMEELLVTKSSPADTAVDLLFHLIKEERPISGARNRAIEVQIKSMSPTQYPQQNVSLYIKEITPLLENLEIAGSWNPEHNSDLCLILANSGGGHTNPEYSHPLFALMNKIDKEVHSIPRGMANLLKTKHFAAAKIGWRDIFKEAEHYYKVQNVPTQVRWPPACNPIDSKTVPRSYGSANLSQYEPRGDNNRSGNSGNSGYQQRGNQRGKVFNKSKPFNKGNGKNPKFVAPDPKTTPNHHVNGVPVYEKTFNGRKMQWCAKCKRYSTTHNTATHTGRPSNGGAHANPDYKSSASVAATASLGMGLIPDPNLWFTCIPVPEFDPSPSPVPIFDHALSTNPTWSSVLQDFKEPISLQPIKG